MSHFAKRFGISDVALRKTCIAIATKQRKVNYDPIIVATFSAIITTGDAVFPETIFGMMEASTTRNPSIP